MMLAEARNRGAVSGAGMMNRIEELAGLRGAFNGNSLRFFAADFRWRIPPRANLFAATSR